MEGIINTVRQELGKQLEYEQQDAVMCKIPQFSEAGIHNEFLAARDAGTGKEKDTMEVLVFNMERGVHLPEICAYLKEHPKVSGADIILANELDDGCVRSGEKDTARELAKELGYGYVYGLEFIELVNEADPKGFHGNAVFSKWPVEEARVVRLPEEYNWYFDRQRRIGGRCAVLAVLNAGGQRIGVGSIHLENRTDGEGRRRQMQIVLREAERMFRGMPVILGGDLNTNTFDGRSKEDIGIIAGSPALRSRCLEDVFTYEALLQDVRDAGYRCLPEKPLVTRRKPLPDGGYLGLRLDWIMVRGLCPRESGMVSTGKDGFGFAEKTSLLRAFAGKELSDHNAVWVSLENESL